MKKNCPENYLFRAYFLAYSINKNLENIKDAIINLEKAINLRNTSKAKIWPIEIYYLYEKKGDFLRESGKYDNAIFEYSKAILSGINNPLELNGVSEGDIILKINNLPATWVNLTTALKLTLPGDEIKFEIYGENNNREVLVKTVASN